MVDVLDYAFASIKQYISFHSCNKRNVLKKRKNLIIEYKCFDFVHCERRNDESKGFLCQFHRVCEYFSPKQSENSRWRKRAKWNKIFQRRVICRKTEIDVRVMNFNNKQSSNQKKASVTSQYSIWIDLYSSGSCIELSLCARLKL